MPSANVIGGQQVLEILGVPDEPGGALSVIEHEGVDGAAFRQRGKRSAPFLVRTVVDQADGATAKTTLATYKALAGGDPISVFDAHGNEWPSLVVHGVRCLELRPIATPVGGGSPTSTVLLVCEWALQSANLG
ncbi:MAG TPA: hypothetical protein PLE19_12735 [Planctomycetota bacterium]|nr:hypothetical protein [Planctomycetota bacterium]HRT95519.1 hypothetical protein [Planctomycetota bacterium]